MPVGLVSRSLPVGGWCGDFQAVAESPTAQFNSHTAQVQKVRDEKDEISMEGRITASLLVGIIILSIMALTMYLDYMDMFVWSAIHHHTAKGKLKSDLLNFCLPMWNMGQLAWIAVIIRRWYEQSAVYRVGFPDRFFWFLICSPNNIRLEGRNVYDPNSSWHLENSPTFCGKREINTEL